MAAPAYVNKAYAELNVSGNASWTLVQGAATGLMSVAACDNSSAADPGTWGGVAPTSQFDSLYSSFPLNLAGWADLSAKSSDGRVAYGPDDHDHFDVSFSASGTLVVVDTVSQVKTAGTGTMSIQLDPAGYDCIAVVAAQEPRGESYRVADWAYNGSGTVTRRYKQTVGESSGQHICVASAPVLASDGVTTFTNAQDQSQPCNAVGMLLGVLPGGRRKNQSIIIF